MVVEQVIRHWILWWCTVSSSFLSPLYNVSPSCLLFSYISLQCTCCIGSPRRRHSLVWSGLHSLKVEEKCTSYYLTKTRIFSDKFQHECVSLCVAAVCRAAFVCSSERSSSCCKNSCCFTKKLLTEQCKKKAPQKQASKQTKKRQFELWVSFFILTIAPASGFWSYSQRYRCGLWDFSINLEPRGLAMRWSSGALLLLVTHNCLGSRWLMPPLKMVFPMPQCPKEKEVPLSEIN